MLKMSKEITNFDELLGKYNEIWNKVSNNIS